MQNNVSKLTKKIMHSTGKALARYGMIQPGDHVLAAMSGGKDSYVLLHILDALRRKSPVPWSLTAIAIDPGGDDFPVTAIQACTDHYGIPLVVERTDIFQAVPGRLRKQKDFCSLCSRFRRGALLRKARDVGAQRIALGHHREDLLETYLMNLFFTGRAMTMAPVLPSSGGAVDIIRPMMLVPGSWVAELSVALGFPAHSCTRGEDTRRHWARTLLANLERANPNVRSSLMRAMQNPVASHSL